MKKEKFGLLNFDSVSILSKEELKKVKGGYDNSWYNESHPSSTIQCQCQVQSQWGWLVSTSLHNWTSYNGSCYNQRPPQCAN